MASAPPLSEYQSSYNYPTTPPPAYEPLTYENASSNQRLIDNGTVSIPIPSNGNFIYQNSYPMQHLLNYADIQQPGIGQPVTNVQQSKKFDRKIYFLIYLI